MVLRSLLGLTISAGSLLPVMRTLSPASTTETRTALRWTSSFLRVSLSQSPRRAASLQRRPAVPGQSEAQRGSAEGAAGFAGLGLGISGLQRPRNAERRSDGRTSQPPISPSGSRPPVQPSAPLGSSITRTRHAKHPAEHEDMNCTAVIRNSGAVAAVACTRRTLGTC